jgi:hypothetical protein
MSQIISEQRAYNALRGGPIRCSVCEESGEEITESHLGDCPHRTGHDARPLLQIMSEQASFERNIMEDQY